MSKKTDRQHTSKPYNPDIANALFRSGYIESWGRGTVKMINDCLANGFPKPSYYYDMSGFIVVFPKNIYNEEYLKSQGLNNRQLKGVQYVKGNEMITKVIYQEINGISKATAERDLMDLVEKNILKKMGESVSTFYILV